MSNVTSRQATFYLLLVSLIWGGTFPLIRDSVQYISPAGFVALRFSLATILFLPFVITHFKRTRRYVLVAGLVLGVLTAVGYFAQTAGLQMISSAQSAFITELAVILIPFFAPLFKLGKPNFLEVVCVMACLFGVYILTGAHFSASSTKILIGEGITFICAITTALSIVYLQKVSKKLNDYRLLVFYQMLFSSFIPVGIYLNAGNMVIHWNSVLIIGLLYCVLLSTALTNYLQARYQRYTTATRVGIIFTMEPVFATLFAFLFNHEPVTKSILIGGGIILGAILLMETLQK